jgi:hypothetical protein
MWSLDFGLIFVVPSALMMVVVVVVVVDGKAKPKARLSVGA